MRSHCPDLPGQSHGRGGQNGGDGPSNMRAGRILRRLALSLPLEEAPIRGKGEEFITTAMALEKLSIPIKVPSSRSGLQPNLYQYSAGGSLMEMPSPARPPKTCPSPTNMAATKCAAPFSSWPAPRSLFRCRSVPRWEVFS